MGVLHIVVAFVGVLRNSTFEQVVSNKMKVDFRKTLKVMTNQAKSCFSFVIVVLYSSFWFGVQEVNNPVTIDKLQPGSLQILQLSLISKKRFCRLMMFNDKVNNAINMYLPDSKVTSQALINNKILYVPMTQIKPEWFSQ